MITNNPSASTLPYSTDSPISNSVQNFNSLNSLSNLASFLPSESQATMLNSLIGGINIQNLSIYYNDSTSINASCPFKTIIDKLNIKFYLESEKLIDNKSPDEVEKINNKLFIILFKQISVYVEEIERLNKKIIELTNKDFDINNLCYISGKNSRTNINNNYSPNNKRSLSKENISLKNIINSLKEENKALERKLQDKINSDEKKKDEILLLKKQLILYKDKNTIDSNYHHKYSSVSPIGFRPNMHKSSSNMRNDNTKFLLNNTSSNSNFFKNKNKNTIDISGEISFQHSSKNIINSSNSISSYKTNNAKMKKSSSKPKAENNPSCSEIKINYFDGKKMSFKPLNQNFTFINNNNGSKDLINNYINNITINSNNSGNTNNNQYSFFNEDFRNLIELYNDEFNELCALENSLIEFKASIASTKNIHSYSKLNKNFDYLLNSSDNSKKEFNYSDDTDEFILTKDMGHIRNLSYNNNFDITFGLKELKEKINEKNTTNNNNKNNSNNINNLSAEEQDKKLPKKPVTKICHFKTKSMSSCSGLESKKNRIISVNIKDLQQNQRNGGKRKTIHPIAHIDL